MPQSRALLTSLPFAFSLLLGCANGRSGNASSSDAGAASVAQASASAFASASAPRVDPRRHGHEVSGPAGALFRASRELTLTDAQQTTIDGLETQLETADPPTDDFKDLQADVVAGIRAGKLDHAKLQTDFTAIDKVMAAHQAKAADALTGLYGALDAGQRKTLVDGIRTKEAARDAQFAAHMDTDAGSADWQKARLERLTGQLKLDPTQQKSVGAVLAKGDPMDPAAMKGAREEGKKRMESILSAFESDHFDAKKLDLGGLPGKTAHEGLEKDTSFLDKLLPVLNADQRELLAKQREHQGMQRHPGMGGPEGHGRPPGVSPM
jgi:hypothetical protein